jgi:hypothetical protein
VKVVVAVPLSRSTWTSGSKDGSLTCCALRTFHLRREKREEVSSLQHQIASASINSNISISPRSILPPLLARQILQFSFLADDFDVALS